MYVIDNEGDVFAVDADTFGKLESAGLIESCDQCSSEFSGRIVGHPVSAGAANTLRRHRGGSGWTDAPLAGSFADLD